jgi:hypothetical protein
MPAVKTLIALIALTASMATHAETFRCGQWIVSSDLTPAEVVTRCGEPASRDSRTEDVRVRNRNNGLMVKVGETTTETWVYARGTQAPPMVITIVDGRIKTIERRK